MTDDLRPPFRQQFDNARDPYTARNALGITGGGGGTGPAGPAGPAGPTGPAGPAGPGTASAEYITAASDATLTAERVLTNTATVTWDFTTAGQAKANAAAGGGGNVSNSGTPTVGQYAKWVTATTIQGVAPATVLSDIGAQPAGSYQPLDDDLTAIAALTGTNTIYYRSAANTWSPVVVSTGLLFSAGNLTSTASFVGFDPSTTVNVALSNGNLTASHISTATNSGARVAVAVGAGKYYFEIKKIVSGADAYGLCTPVNTYNQVLATNATVIMVGMTGNINVFAAFIANIGSIAANDVIGFAIDFGAGLVWVRRNAGTWNASGTANPATGIGGASFIAGTALAPVVGFGAGAATEQCIANFGVTAYANAAPSGFSNWPLAAYQPLDGDLTAIAALTGTNVIYYRSAADTWAPVTIGTNLTFTGGTLNATGGGGSATPGPPQGRLTLQTATPVMTTTQSAKTTIFYALYCGNLVPIWDGTSMTMTAFTELSNVTTASSTGKAGPAAVAASSMYDLFVWNDAGTVRLTRGPLWTNDTTRSAGTALVRVNGIWLNNATITNGPAASRGTYVGTVRSNASSQIDWILGGTGAGGVAGWLGVWNAYNRRLVQCSTKDSTDSWAYLTNAWQPANNSLGMKVSVVVGLEEDAISAFYGSVTIPNSSSVAYVGIGYDSTTAILNNNCITGLTTLPNYYSSIYAAFQNVPAIGFHYLIPLEAASVVGTTFYGDNGAPTLTQAGFHVGFQM